MLVRSLARIAVVLWTVSASLTVADASAQALPERWQGVPPVRLVEGALLTHTADEPNVLVRVMTTGLSHPWSMAFLPNGDILVTERPGRLRVIRDGKLDPTPVSGVPPVSDAGQFTGLLEVAPHPDFASNRLLYLTYRIADEDSRLALARARFDGSALLDMEVLFVSGGAGFTTSSGSRIAFAPDGTLFMPVGGTPNATSSGLRAQDLGDHSGKILRVRDDGSAPDDNPFVERGGALPEIFSLGHRTVMGLAFHPETGELWAVEHGPQGGDEVNIIRPGANYGWPHVSYGREYSGGRISEVWWQAGTETPTVVWIPSVAPSGLMFYTGERFPAWSGDLFVGAMQVGRVVRTGRLERVILNEAGEEVGREAILSELRQRIRDVRQGPDGLIYLLTDEDEGALIRLEPID